MSTNRRRRHACAAAATLLALAAGASGAGASSVAPAGRQGRDRSWGGTWIESLDPALTARLRGAAAPNQGELANVNGAPSPSEGKRAYVAGAPSPSDTSRPPQSQVLSNETTFTRWAYVNQIVSIYQRPTQSSARVTRLRWSTEDGFPQIYLVLRAYRDAKGREWVKLRIPMRPNGRTGWVQRDALGAFHLTHLLLVVDRQLLRVSLYSRGRLVWHAPAAVGKPSTPTPPGRFWITERFKIDDPNSGYYPYAFGTSDYSTLTDWPGGGVVGIHGPYYEPQLIPGRISHGCIRLRVSDDDWLANHRAGHAGPHPLNWRGGPPIAKQT